MDETPQNDDWQTKIRGWVYLITNDSLPGLVKVGYSTKDPELRARELGNTGVPGSYKVAHDFLVHSPRRVEQAVHLLLDDRREGKEWFRCSTDQACEAIETVLRDPKFYCSEQVKGDEMPPAAPREDSSASEFPTPTQFGGGSARWRFLRRTGQLRHKISGQVLTRDEYRYDPKGSIKGFQTRLREMPWIQLSDVEFTA